jgi:hypothetical protein
MFTYLTTISLLIIYGPNSLNPYGSTGRPVPAVAVLMLVVVVVVAAALEARQVQLNQGSRTVTGVKVCGSRNFEGIRHWVLLLQGKKAECTIQEHLTFYDRVQCLVKYLNRHFWSDFIRPT